jgi:MoxR-like ATPase
MKLRVDYPTADEELAMLGRYLDPTADAVPVARVLTLAEIRQIAHLAARVHVDERISRYIIQIVTATRTPAAFRLQSLAPLIAFGASPRATLSMAHVAKGHAFLEGRDYVIPEDVKAVAHDVIRHRLVLSYEAAAEQMSADRIIDQIIGAVAVP